jgi:uncharacterized lipoprotein YehR (DUF1307 family)
VLLTAVWQHSWSECCGTEVVVVVVVVVVVIIIIIIIIKLDNKHRYDHVPKSVETSHEGKVTILRNQQVQTERTIPNNKPDITFRDNKNGTCMSINVISGDRCVIQQESENILKYENLTSDIRRIWNVNAKVITVIIGATVTI